MTPAEINALVAEKVMGWTLSSAPSGLRIVALWCDSHGQPLRRESEWFPSTSIADAREIEDEIERRGLKWKYTQALVSLSLFFPEVPDFVHDEDLWWFLIHATPEQRSLAALKTVGVDIDSPSVPLAAGAKGGT
jgi:hypothetical protein